MCTTALQASSYLQDLEELGYCVIKEVVTPEETKELYTRVWHEYIEKAWPQCKMDDRSNWEEAFPLHNKSGIFAGSAGQIQVMWDVRQDPRIVDIFAKIWNTNDLVVSMDGLSFMCPPEIREGYQAPWPHVDQPVGCDKGFVSESPLKTAPYTIQGQLLLEDSFDGDGGFYCIPRSHLQFNEFAPQLEATKDKDERRAILNDLFNSGVEHVQAPRGSLILWDSRTIHWNQHPSKDRPLIASPKVRMVCYLCYVPKSRCTEEAKAIRRQAFESGIATGHDPASPILMDTRTKGNIPEQYERYLVDPAYKQPRLTLTELGESLLGIHP